MGISENEREGQMLSKNRTESGGKEVMNDVWDEDFRL